MIWPQRDLKQSVRRNNNSPDLRVADRGGGGVGRHIWGWRSRKRDRFSGWILGAGLENFYFANFGGNVILFLQLKKIKRGKWAGGAGRREVQAQPARGSAVFRAPAFWPLIPGPRPARLPDSRAVVIGGSLRPAIDDRGVLISRKHRGCRGHLGVIIRARRDSEFPRLLTERNKSSRLGESRLSKMNY